MLVVNFVVRVEMMRMTTRRSLLCRVKACVIRMMMIMKIMKIIMTKTIVSCTCIN